MYYPEREEFIKLAEKERLVPVYREILGDMMTPVMAFKSCKEKEYSFLLESVQEGTLGRYSFIGLDPLAVFKSFGERIEIEWIGMKPEEEVEAEVFQSKDPLLSLKRFFSTFKPVRVPGLPSFCGGCVGYMGYEMITSLEGLPQGEDVLKTPHLFFLIPSTMMIFHHTSNKIQVVRHVLTGADPNKEYEEALYRIQSLLESLKGERGDLSNLKPPKKKVEVQSNCTLARFSSMVEEARSYIRGGDIFQVVLSQRLKAPLCVEPFSLYRSLRLINPSPYMFYLNFQDTQLVGSSPEVLVRLEGDRISTRPLAGTRRRGRNEKEDREQAKDLLEDEKERAEHLMLVDLGRNDLGRVSQYGSVEVSRLMEIEYYSHVMHIVSRVQGRLHHELGAFDVLRAAFPAGTVSGAPKIRAMEIIQELEGVVRGPYAGAVGYFSFNGDMDTCITIRTFLIKEGWVYLQAGAGIVADSLPEKEYEETLNKAQALLSALSLAEENWANQ